MRLFHGEKITEVPLHKGEPFFLIRGRENMSIAALLLIRVLYGEYEMTDIIAQFRSWRRTHKDLCKDFD